MIPQAGVSLRSYDYLRRLAGEQFESSPIWDAHTHIGRDHDGRSLDVDGLLADLDRYHVAGAVVFPFNDPDQGVDFRIPNERVWKVCQQVPERLIPFMRLNLNGPWEAEYGRGVERGCRGIKLHPRAQCFSLSSPTVQPLFARAAADGLPILVHTGLGMTAITDDLAALATDFPDLKLVLAHSSFIDMPDALRVLAAYPNVYFETSVVRMYDLFTVLCTVDPQRVIYGSDLPYASSYTALLTLVMTAYFARVDPTWLPDLLGRNLLRLIAPERLSATPQSPNAERSPEPKQASESVAARSGRPDRPAGKDAR